MNGKKRYTIINTDGWGWPDMDGEQEGHNYAVYDLVTETIAKLEGSICRNLTKADAALVIARLEGCP